MLLIFDIDGVVADFTQLKLLRDEVHVAAVAKKHSLSLEKAKALFYKTKESNKLLGKHSTIDTMLSLGVSKQEFYQIMNSVEIAGNIIPTKEVQAIVKKLSEKHMLVTLTNTPYKATKKTLQSLGILPYFTKIYAIDTHHFTKPSTEIYKQILFENNFPPQQAISIGDSFEKDLLPAKEAGLTTILFYTQENNKQDSPVDYIITNLQQLLDILLNVQDSFSI